MINKIGIVGGGNIGGVLVAEIVARRLARNVSLVDVKGPDLAAGKCLDIAEATPVYGRDVKLVGAKTYEILEGCDFVINTAGVPRAMRADGTFPSRGSGTPIFTQVSRSAICWAESFRFFGGIMRSASA